MDNTDEEFMHILINLLGMKGFETNRLEMKFETC